MQAVQEAEALIDLLLEMGRALFEKKQYDDANTWLSRGYEMLSHMDLGLMSPDAGELRLCLMHIYGSSISFVESDRRLTKGYSSEGSAYER